AHLKPTAEPPSGVNPRRVLAGHHDEGEDPLERACPVPLEQHRHLLVHDEPRAEKVCGQQDRGASRRICHLPALLEMRLAYVSSESYASCMRTTVDLPEDLVEEARRTGHFRTKQETLVAGLQELIRKSHREALRQLAGKVDLEVDLTRSRGKRRKR